MRADRSGAVQIILHVHSKCDMDAALDDHSAHNLIMQQCDRADLLQNSRESRQLNVVTELHAGPL